eukprot:GHUV01014116.1.p1 GENE.GHUV01014116.1~~GHUV01014116.1.p1  ORF type:complete len:160 (+),score=30.52 GHUV01014116.1:437-916(+)
MAAAMHLNVHNFSISVQALYFCPEQAPSQTCDAGWTLPAALQQLKQRGSHLPVAECLPNKPDLRGDLSKLELCKSRCNSINTFAGQGTFSSTSITTCGRQSAIYGNMVESCLSLTCIQTSETFARPSLKPCTSLTKERCLPLVMLYCLWVMTMPSSIGW